MGKISVIGIGPGEEVQMTKKAFEKIMDSDVIVGYTGYISLLGEAFQNKEKRSTGMLGEVERCRLCFELAHEENKKVALICSGDPGIYGMAALIYGLANEYEKIEIEVVAGVSAAGSGAALLGAPINHDFCTISLSDLLTPWEKIEKRLRAAAQGDLAIVLYNPSSKKRKDYLKRACKILLETLPETTACGYVKNIGREGTITWVGNLSQLQEETVDMFTTCFIGNSQSYIENGKLITPRGYLNKV